MNKLILENLANEFRTKELQISLFEPVSIHKALRTTGILCSFRPLDDDISGMAIKIQHNGDNQAHRFMLINTNDRYCKQRFTACHEFYHLIYQQNFTKSVDDSGYVSTVEREERYANIFASFLLLPEAGLKMLAPVEEQRKDRVSLGTILKLEQHFRCSRMTLLLRLKTYVITVITSSVLRRNTVTTQVYMNRPETPKFMVTTTSRRAVYLTKV